MKDQKGFVINNYLIKGFGLFTILVLAQSIYYSSTQFFFIGIVAVTIIAYFFLPIDKSLMLFLIIPFGPVLNHEFFCRDAYVYTFEIVLLTYFSLYFILNNFDYTKIYKNNFIYFVVFFLSISFISSLVHFFTAEDLLLNIRLSRGIYIAASIFVFLLFNNKNAYVKTFTHTTIYASAIVVAFGIADYLYTVFLKQNVLYEPGSLFSGSETFSIYLSTVLPLLIVMSFWAEKSKTKILSTLTTIAGFALLLSTRSRAGLFAILLFGILFIPVATKNNTGLNKKLIYAFIFIVFIMPAFLVILLKSTGYNPDRFLDIDRLIYGIFSSRIEALKTGITGIATAPLFGHGSYYNVYNLFLQMAVQFGVIAMISFLFIWLKLILAYPKSMENSESGILKNAIYWACLGLLFCSLAESTMGNQLGYHSWFFILLLGQLQMKRTWVVLT